MTDLTDFCFAQLALQAFAAYKWKKKFECGLFNDSAPSSVEISVFEFTMIIK